MDAPFTVAEHIEFEKQHKSYLRKAKKPALIAAMFLVLLVFLPIGVLVDIIEGRSEFYLIDMPLWIGVPLNILLFLWMLHYFRKLSREENNLRGQARYYGLLADLSAQSPEVLNTTYAFMRDLEVLSPADRPKVWQLLQQIDSAEDEHAQRAVEEMKDRLEKGSKS